MPISFKEGRYNLFNTMNTVRPRPYPQKGTSANNANNGATDKDGHNSNAQDQRQQQAPQTIARGRAEDVKQTQGETRAAINSPAQNAYPQRQAYPTHTPPPMRTGSPIPINQVNPQQYQAMQSQAGYQPIQQSAPAPAPAQATPQRSNKVNIAQILKDCPDSNMSQYLSFDADRNLLYNGKGIYSFQMNGITYFTNETDLMNSMQTYNDYSIEGIDMISRVNAYLELERMINAKNIENLIKYISQSTVFALNFIYNTKNSTKHCNCA